MTVFIYVETSALSCIISEESLCGQNEDGLLALNNKKESLEALEVTVCVWYQLERDPRLWASMPGEEGLVARPGESSDLTVAQGKLPSFLVLHFFVLSPSSLK